MKKRIEEVLNQQINEELYSAYLYQAIRAYFESIGLSGFSNWMKVQAEEELFHAEKFFSHIVQRGGRIRLTAIKEPAFEWKNPLDAFKASLEHEKHITSCIHNLVSVAEEEKDYPSKTFLNWFVDEQVEEEDNVSKIVQELEMIENDGKGLLMIDRELSSRTFTPPTNEE
ncbi:MAG: ferritin [Caldisericia bacterium]|nr:ferritin [Caldisericia bacterium]MDD4614078.1 ferritin [Caldisericia bacterium]